MVFENEIRPAVVRAARPHYTGEPPVIRRAGCRF